MSSGDTYTGPPFPELNETAILPRINDRECPLISLAKIIRYRSGTAEAGKQPSMTSTTER